ncbi:MAG: hypothetical protein LBE89_02340 [Helicobacteraceae bacterium]|jgi:F-type H+-transporting ATPase subunit b|nr:hypothetical protein [Helicobacteraceae bacterium]
MIKKICIVFFAISGCAFASTEVQADIVERTINFAIFAALIYLLLAKHIRSFFAGRTQSITAVFEKAQERAKEAKSAREDAQLRLEQAKEQAKEIIALASEDAAAAAARIAIKSDEEVRLLHRLKEENKTVIENKIIRAVVTEAMGEILSADDFLSDQKAIVENLIKRVA